MLEGKTQPRGSGVRQRRNGKWMVVGVGRGSSRVMFYWYIRSI